MHEDIALRLIERCSKYLEPASSGLSNYEFWVASEEEVSPGVSIAVRVAALRLLKSRELPLRLSAIQALACTGREEDISSLEQLRKQDHEASSDISAAVEHLRLRTVSVEALLGEVDSEASFVRFARALAHEREVASKVEAADPERYALDGALAWKNADVASFIYAALTAFEGRSGSSPPSWQDFAKFLYLGKVYE